MRLGSMRLVSTTQLTVALACSLLASPVIVASAAGATVTPATDCVILRLRATPQVNAQTAPYDTIRNAVGNCATFTETVVLVQSIIGPFALSGAAGRSWTITLAPGTHVDKVQFIPYSCCGTYSITDKVRSTTGTVLTQRGTSFTFA